MKCAACQQDIDPTDMVVGVKRTSATITSPASMLEHVAGIEATWHLGCYKCGGCGESLIPATAWDTTHFRTKSVDADWRDEAWHIGCYNESPSAIGMIGRFVLAENED